MVQQCKDLAKTVSNTAPAAAAMIAPDIKVGRAYRAQRKIGRFSDRTSLTLSAFASIKAGVDS
jgi:hypothetical protein